jgi:hypothetical protein
VIREGMVTVEEVVAEAGVASRAVMREGRSVREERSEE